MGNTGKCVALVAAECEENLAVRYIWSALEQAGHRVRLIAFNDGGTTESTARELARSGADVAGFSMVFTARRTAVIAALRVTPAMSAPVKPSVRSASSFV